MMTESKLGKIFQFMDTLGLGERDPFGNPILFKRIVMMVLGFISYNRLTVYNKTKITGTEHLENLPEQGVLFFRNTINYPIYLMAPRSNLFYVAASETMKNDGFLPRVMAQAGAILVNRSWRAEGVDVKREVDLAAVEKIGKGLKFGWVISFPQGTTRAFAPLRKGTAHLIKGENPIVVPVRINGFRRAFDKKGLLIKKRNTTLTVEFREPIRFDSEATTEEILERLRQEIGLEHAE
ncbi:MAG: 1-acylglycerol-3-phosphate O-acyltransferase [Bacteroidota bacterium]